MLDSFWFAILIGAVLGFLSGLGVGGGSLLLLWLTVVLGTQQSQARLMNLMFFIPCAAIACLFRWKQGNLNPPKILIPIIFGLLGTVLGNLLGQQLNVDILKKVFGIFFIICGIREIRYRPRKLR